MKPLNRPQHVAIVMDGNGRWANERGLLRVEGHKAGINTAKQVVEACLENQIPWLSLFAFSSENWSRPAHEVDFLMTLLLTGLDEEVQTLHTHGVRLRFVGDRTALSAALNERMCTAEALTKDNLRLSLHIVLNYGGKWDIVEAAKAVASAVLAKRLSVEAIDPACFATHLSMASVPDPDLLIRTGGEQRLSNFFLWQLAYTELYFTKTPWPAFTKTAFQKALQHFANRDRRYGNIIQEGATHV